MAPSRSSSLVSSAKSTFSTSEYLHTESGPSVRQKENTARTVKSKTCLILLTGQRDPPHPCFSFGEGGGSEPSTDC